MQLRKFCLSSRTVFLQMIDCFCSMFHSLCIGFCKTLVEPSFCLFQSLSIHNVGLYNYCFRFLVAPWTFLTVHLACEILNFRSLLCLGWPLWLTLEENTSPSPTIQGAWLCKYLKFHLYSFHLLYRQFPLGFCPISRHSIALLL